MQCRNADDLRYEHADAPVFDILARRTELAGATAPLPAS
jgi:hypothetical protein